MNSDHGHPVTIQDPVTVVELGRRLTKMRKRLHLHVEDLADRVSADPADVRKFEDVRILLSLFLTILRDLTPGLELNPAFDAPRFEDLDGVRAWRHSPSE